jgi:8-oxo-dGTP pyrophosphatase MutT (NUDIX family)
MASRLSQNRQYGALPCRLRADGGVEILLVTSRESDWIIPKGWSMARLAAHEAAAQEAVEEGGIVGSIRARPIGNYRYAKRRGAAPDSDCEVTVFALRVHKQLAEWPEQHQRRTRWFRLRAAAKAVKEPELAALIRKSPGLGDPARLTLIPPSRDKHVAGSLRRARRQ